MEINKISVGVETLENPVKVGVVSESKLDKFKEIAISFSGKAARLFKKSYLYMSRFVKSIPAFMKKWKTKDGFSSDTGVSHRDGFKLRRSAKIKKGLVLAAVLLILISVAAIARVRLLNFKNSSSSSTLGDRVEIKAPLKTLNIQKEFQFPVKDAKGKEVTKLKYYIDQASIQNEIIVKGQKATAVKGREFLIINLKLTNEYSAKLDINTRNYVRLSVNGNEDEWLAPDIHNDPVEVQAQSTKATRLGFPINESDTKMVLRVGEIDGEKQRVELNF